MEDKEVRLIDANELLSKVEKAYMFEDRRGQLAHAIQCIKQAPTVEAEPVRHGRIEPMTNEDIKRFVVDSGMPVFNSQCCSCGAMCFNDDTYCAECGTKLDEE